MFIVALAIITKNWKIHKCPSMGEWINKSFIEHSSALRRKELPIHVTK